jgi:serine/threonine protein phosphatase PrpC
MVAFVFSKHIVSQLFRVWFLDANYPGTAFTRSLGDRTAEGVGVIAVPEITVLDLTADHPFLVFDSDGIFEFLSSQAVIDMVAKFIIRMMPVQQLLQNHIGCGCRMKLVPMALQLLSCRLMAYMMYGVSSPLISICHVACVYLDFA